jgi:hypothetical protein
MDVPFCNGFGGQGELPRKVIRCHAACRNIVMGRNKNDGHIRTRIGQIFLQFQAAHSRHAHIENKHSFALATP